MCSFLGTIKTLFWCLTVRQRRLAIISLSIIIILGMSLSVTAFYFDFQYFETDKMVYEVGETVDMVARLIADFNILVARIISTVFEGVKRNLYPGISPDPPCLTGAPLGLQLHNIQ